MDRDELGERVSGVAALAEPVRRDLYLYVVAQQHPVSRDEACEALGIARHTAKFHLDKLVEEGLLVTSFKRLSERRGPGAGRPTKLYERSDRELSVTVPERRYDLAGQLMAQAIEESTRSGVPTLEALHATAQERGRSIGQQLRSAVQRGRSAERLLEAASSTLDAHGYEASRLGRTLTLRNCPFHLLAQEHTSLVCGMNLALLEGAVAEVGDDRLRACLDPAPGRCCVVLTADPA
ncbi:MAG: Transcriptional regulator [uncultured Friedmanniella sp.]|uniref:Transcriptional regulator n=1 Tax=uncultured Friedmanniella sp. TaxID=335381 RepID=A0A6J4KCA6_9ACTN|nr:helix-turn-helix domain-containing protein [uncultured Friedmanniella sp.]CAA9300461.1 MAG: Transcriptional regulator [uncultured Friedmanniella sp.]